MIWTLLSYAFWCLGGNVAHDIHVSVIEIEYDEKMDSYQVAAKLFIDDLTEALALREVADPRLFDSQESPSADDHILAYLQDHLIINADGYSLQWNWIGKEITKDLMASWCYIEASPQKTHDRITINADVLMELFDDQQNIIKLNAKGSNWHFLQTPDDAPKSIDY